MELKFRAWNVIVKRYEYFTLQDIAGMTEKIQWHILEIEQYVKNDVNNKEIYECDIFKFKLQKEKLNLHNPYEYIDLEGFFVYNEDELRYEIELLEKYEKEGYVVLHYNPEIMKDFEIIGNIHEK